MSWKKTWLYFAWQSLKYAKNLKHFQQIWSYKKRWSDSFQKNRSAVSDELPWINFLALDFLEAQLQHNFKVFEFGGGGSTLFFCKKVEAVMTVEDHAEWFKTLTEMVKTKGYDHWTGFFVAPEILTDSNPRSHTNPADFKSSIKSLEQKSFEKYARTIDPYPEDFFDLILVDGRARPSCIQQAIPHLKKGGLLVVDNTERPYYLAPFQEIIRRDFIIEINQYAPVGYTPDFTITSILRKK